LYLFFISVCFNRLKDTNDKEASADIALITCLYHPRVSLLIIFMSRANLVHPRAS